MRQVSVRRSSGRLVSPVSGRLAWPLIAVLLLCLGVSHTHAACSVERAGLDSSGPFTVRVSKDCSEPEREAQAVLAADLLKALAAQRPVDVEGAVIVGDLALDTLPAVNVDLVPLTPRIQHKVAAHKRTGLPVVVGPLAIRHSVVRGNIKTHAKDAVVIIRGAVVMTGTLFERMVDLSRTIFLGPVDFSTTVLMQQAFFIDASFEQAATFERAAFGIHSRFHKATFGDVVTFHRAGFNGLSEFLEVLFEKDARFSQAYFKLGTGFSGTRFRGTVDFSEATFEREAYFSFAVFENDAYFRRATFRSEANFADTEFKGLDDFSKTFFNQEPRFTRAKASGQRVIPKGLQDARVLYVIAATLLAFSLLFAFILRKS